MKIVISNITIEASGKSKKKPTMIDGSASTIITTRYRTLTFEVFLFTLFHLENRFYKKVL